MKKILVISPESKLSREDFTDVVKSWLDIYGDLHGSGFINEKMVSGLLRVAASFYVIDELKNSPAAYRISKAAQIAAKNDAKSIKAVFELLKECWQIISK